MHKYFFAAIIILISPGALSQPPIDSLILKEKMSLDSLIQTEKDFAAYSVRHSTKDAFLTFLDSSGVVFTNGQPVNGMESWSHKEQTKGVLNWHPEFAGIASSGELGFTTGPWTFRQTTEDTIIAHGVYTTVWRFDKTGKWKFLVDLGATNTSFKADTLSIILRKSDKLSKGALSSLLQSEKEFIELSKDPEKAYKNYLASICVLNRNNQLPKNDLWESTPKTIQYTISNSGISSSGDFGYVYGSTLINGKTDGYLRIWRREMGQWRIIAEVLRY